LWFRPRYAQTHKRFHPSPPVVYDTSAGSGIVCALRSEKEGDPALDHAWFRYNTDVVHASRCARITLLEKQDILQLFDDAWNTLISPVGEACLRCNKDVTIILD